ncbi:MAG: Uma2 family endonuclease [Raineya sp.]|nr:Uma2 family endonuclease [Raineya sp.]
MERGLGGEVKMPEILEKIWTAAEFLNFERKETLKHELIANEIYLMAGASINHNRIVKNLLLILERLFANTEFEAFSSDVRVADLVNNSFCYPDLLVIAGEPQFVDNEFDTVTNPVLICEVLSKGTESYDKEKKFDVYQALESLQEYLIVWQDKPKARLFRKISQKHWEMWDFDNENENINLLERFSIKLQDIYQKVKF